MSILDTSGPAALNSSPKARAVRSLRHMLERGELRHGDRLPPESKLASEFDVSRMTLRSALDVLEEEGLVRRQRNIGCFSAVSSKPKSGLMARTIAMVTDHEPASDAKLFGGTSASLVSGVMDRVGSQKLNFLRVTPETNRDAWLRELLAVRPSGVIVSSWKCSIDWHLNVLDELSANGVPVTCWGDSTRLQKFDCVASDHVGGARELVRCLAAAGKRRILRLWTLPSDVPWIQAHDRGYELGVAEAGVESLPPVHVEGLADRGLPTESEFRIRVRHLAGYLAEQLHSDRPIDAIMTATDNEAVVALAACRLFNAGPVAVTGYDNYWQGVPERRWEPGALFATVDKSNHRLGEEMVELLLARISGSLPPEPQLRLIEQKIIATCPVVDARG